MSVTSTYLCSDGFGISSYTIVATTSLFICNTTGKINDLRPFPFVNPCFYAITSYYLSSFTSKANIVNLTCVSTKVIGKMQCQVSHTLKTRISAHRHKKDEKPEQIIDTSKSKSEREYNTTEKTNNNLSKIIKL